MTFQDAMTLISTVAFPIAMCLLMAWFIYFNQCQHKEEMAEIRDTVNNNTLVLQKLVDKLDSMNIE